MSATSAWLSCLDSRSFRSSPASLRRWTVGLVCTPPADPERDHDVNYTIGEPFATGDRPARAPGDRGRAGDRLRGHPGHVRTAQPFVACGLAAPAGTPQQTSRGA